MNRLIDAHFEGDKLEVVLEWFRQTVGVNMQVNESALEAAGIEQDCPVSLKVTQLPARKVLTLILQRVAAGAELEPIDFDIRDNIVFVSTLRDLQGKMVVRHYDLSDFLYPLEERFTIVLNEAPWIKLGDPLPAESRPTREEIIDQITWLIVDTVGKQNVWAAYAGEVSTLLEIKNALTVNATMADHRKIEATLNALLAHLQRRRIVAEREKLIAPLLMKANDLRLRGEDQAALALVREATALVPTHPVAQAMQRLIEGTIARRSGKATIQKTPAVRVVAMDTPWKNDELLSFLPKADQAVWRRLAQPIDVNFRHVDIKSAIEEVARKVKVNLFIGSYLLDVEPDDKPAAVTCKGTNVPAAVVIKILLDELSDRNIDAAPVTFIVQDGVVEMGSRRHLKRATVVQHHDIADLLNWPLDGSAVSAMELEPGMPGDRDMDETPMSRDEMVESLATMIQDQIGEQPDWAAYGGEHYTLKEYGGELIIKTSPLHQAEIAMLLKVVRDRMIDTLERQLAEQAIRPMLDEAGQRRDAKDYAGALKLIEAALVIRPDHPQAGAMRVVLKQAVGK